MNKKKENKKGKFIMTNKEFLSRIVSVVTNKFLLLPLGIFLLVSLLFHTSLVMEDVTVEDENGITRNIQLPYFKKTTNNREYIFKGTINYHKLSQNWISILPDDKLRSIAINGRTIPFYSIRGARLANWKNSLHFNIGKYLNYGDNEIRIIVFDRYGNFGLSVSTSRKDPLLVILVIIITLSIIAFLYLILKRFNFSKLTIFILLTGFVVHFLYFSVTPYTKRSQDVVGHIKYIEYVSKHYALPNSNAGWQFYQPPLYYISAAVIYKSAQALGVTNKFHLYSILQCYSLLLYFIFLITVVVIIKRLFNVLEMSYKKNKYLNNFKTRTVKHFLVNKKALFSIVLGLFVFWPSSIIHSVRIGNDVAMYLFYALGLLYLIDFFTAYNFKKLYVASFFAVLGIMSKTNALVLFILIGFLLVYLFIKDKDKFSFIKKASIACLILLIGFSLVFGSQLINYLKGKQNHVLVGNWGSLNRVLHVKNRAENYLYFDTKIFFTKPFTDPWRNGYGRQYFLNYFLKSSLTGEYNFKKNWHKDIAIVLSYLLIGLIIFSFGGLFLLNRQQYKKHMVILSSFAFLFISAIAFRISAPASCSTDFRYVLPILISFCFFFGLSLVQYRKKGWIKLSYFGYILAGLFIFFSNLFFIGLVL